MKKKEKIVTVVMMIMMIIIKMSMEIKMIMRKMIMFHM